MPLVPSLLRENREFRRLFAADSISLIGDQITLIALPLTAVLVLDAGAADMGYLTAAGLLPYLLFSLHAGAWVDRRGGRRRKMIAADLVRAVVVATVPLAYAFDVLTMQQLFVTEFLVGSLAVVFRVSHPTLFISVVPRDAYVQGQSLVNGTRAFSFVAGPTLGGLLVQAVTAPVTLVLDAFSYVASAFYLGSISPEEPATEEAARGHVLSGLRFIRGSPVVRSSLLATATVNFFNFVFWALFVLYATRELGVAAGTLGLVLGAGAIGGVVGSVVTGRISRRIGIGPAFVVGCVLFPLPLVLVPLADGPLGDRLLALPRRVLVGRGRDDARHQRGLDLRGDHPRPPPLTRLRGVLLRQLRRPAARLGGRRLAREHDWPPADALDRRDRRARRRPLAPTVADPGPARPAGAGRR
jgi:MFS family permease